MVWNIFYFHPHLGKWSSLTNIFQLGWNYQPVEYANLGKVVKLFRIFCFYFSPWNLGKWFPIWRAYFFNWVGSTTEYETCFWVLNSTIFFVPCNNSNTCCKMGPIWRIVFETGDSTNVVKHYLRFFHKKKDHGRWVAIFNNKWKTWLQICGLIARGPCWTQHTANVGKFKRSKDFPVNN